MAVNQVHLVFKTHLDVGFTDYARNVVKQYFEDFIPRALQTAQTLRERGGDERFIWTTGSWLIYEFLEQANAADRKRMEDAILAGDIAWHALPFTTHTELMDVSLFRFGLSLSQSLDQRFGRQTIAAKMTDVPGHTRGIVPLLAEAGVRFLHIGVNPASKPPDVPPVFVWKDPDTDASIIVMYQKGAYGDTQAVEGLREALAFAHTNDNHGPQSADEVIASFEAMRNRFPQAQVHASTLDAFARALTTAESTLPVITAEIGDTWIHGVGTDPKKVSLYRSLVKLRNYWLDQGKISLDDPHLQAFSRKLLMIPEHTWGMDEKTHFADYVHYEKKSFWELRHNENFERFEASWQEQRDYLKQAVSKLKPSPMFEQAQATLSSISNRISGVAMQSLFRTSSPNLPTNFLDTTHFQVGLDNQTGAITHLVKKADGREWASPEHPLSLLRYQTFSHEDYDRFWRQYVVNKRETEVWSRPDQTKPGMASAGQPSRFWQFQLEDLSFKRTPDAYYATLMLNAIEECWLLYGCPRRAVLEFCCPDDEPVIEITLEWYDKPASRLPEALWLSFVPKITDNKGWTMDKLGKRISPLEVIKDGNRHLHAVNAGVFYEDKNGSLSILSPDVPLVAPGEPSLLNFTNRQPDMRKGMHFNLYNNVWGTNFPMWYDEPASFNFTLKF